MAAVSNRSASPASTSRSSPSNSVAASPPPPPPDYSSNPSPRSSSQFVTPLTSFIKGMSKSTSSPPPSPIVTNANSSPIISGHRSARTPPSTFLPSSSSPASVTTSGITKKTNKHLDIGTSVVLASDFAWICGLLFSSSASTIMADYRELLIVITIIIIFSICIGLVAFLTSVTFPVVSRAMKVITISAGIVGAILSTCIVFLVLR